MDGGELETALGTCDEPWEDQSWEEPEETEFPDDDWTDELPTRRPRIGRSIWLPGSSGGPYSDGVQECFVGHEKRHTNIHGGQGFGFSSKPRKRLLPCGRCGCFRWFSNVTPRGSRQTGAGKGASTGMNSQAGKGRGRGVGKGKPPRDSRRPSPGKSRVTLTGTAKGGPTHGTRVQPGQCLLCRQMGHLARDCPNRGTRDDSGINLKRAFGSFVVMIGDRDVSRLCGTVPFPLVSSACVLRCKIRLFCWDSDGTTVNSTSFFNAATLTSDSADHRERYEVDQGISLINSLQHFESFDEGHIFWTVHSMSITCGGSLCRVGSLCGGRRQRLCAAGHWSIQISWRLHDGTICD